MKLFFSAGEPSGDVHAAALIEKLKQADPSVECVGFGGPKMQAAGCVLLADLTRLAIMWVLQAITHYFKFRRLLEDAKRYFRTTRVDAVILVDYPGFNWHVALAAKEQGIPVFYFMPPQIWAWGQWRVKKMQQRVDGILCPLPFEQRWFQGKGIKTVYIGHPFFEEIRTRKSDIAFLETFYAQMGDGPILALLPGSRNQEVRVNLDEMILTAQYVRSKQSNVRPVFAAFSRDHAEYIGERLKELEITIPIFVGHTQELICAADCALSVSGSVSLELLACNVPTVIYYRIGVLPLFIQRFFRRSRYITLVNMLAVDSERKAGKSSPSIFYDDRVRMIPAEPDMIVRDSMYFPEFLTAKDRSKDAASYLIHWLSDPIYLASQKRRLAELLREVDHIHSPLERAAEAIRGAVSGL